MCLVGCPDTEKRLSNRQYGKCKAVQKDTGPLHHQAMRIIAVLGVLACLLVEQYVCDCSGHASGTRGDTIVISDCLNRLELCWRRALTHLADSQRQLCPPNIASLQHASGNEVSQLCQQLCLDCVRYSGSSKATHFLDQVIRLRLLSLSFLGCICFCNMHISLSKTRQHQTATEEIVVTCSEHTSHALSDIVCPACFQ